MTALPRIAAAAALLALAACSSAPSSQPDLPYYELRPLPGPDAFENRVTFERNSLWISAKADLESDVPQVEVELRNLGPVRLTVRPDRMAFRSPDGAKSSRVLVFDEKKEEVMSFTLFKSDRRILKIRPANDEQFGKVPFVLELRGMRDERGDGGFDFDLIARERPTPDPEQALAKMPAEKKQESLRPLYDSMREPPQRADKK